MNLQTIMIHISPFCIDHKVKKKRIVKNSQG